MRSYMVDMTFEEILTSIESFNREPKNTSFKDYWKQVNEVAQKEHDAFEIEEKRLAMSEEVLHRCFGL